MHYATNLTWRAYLEAHQKLELESQAVLKKKYNFVSAVNVQEIDYPNKQSSTEESNAHQNNVEVSQPLVENPNAGGNLMMVVREANIAEILWKQALSWTACKGLKRRD